MSSSMIPMRNVRALPIFGTVLVFGGLLLVTVFLMSDWVKMTYPLNDEFALIAESQASVSGWFVHGYSQYFIPYPEFFEPYTNFVRPVANVVYRLFSYVQSGLAKQLVFVNYATVAMIAAVLYALARQLGHSLRFSIGLALAAYVAPAFWDSPMPIQQACMLDGLAALLCLIGVWLCLGRWWLSGLVALCLAAFTKEGALPIAVGVSVFGFLVHRRNLGVGAAFIVVAWLATRLIAFHGVGGVYAFDMNNGAVRSISKVQQLAYLPIGYGMVPGGARSVFRILVVGGNALLWVWLLFSVGKSRQLITSLFNGELRQQRDILAILAIGLLALSGVFLILVGGSARFSYIFYVFFLVYVASIPQGRSPGVALGIVLALALSSFSLCLVQLRSERAVYALRYQISRELLRAMAHLPTDRSATYLANDFVTGYSSAADVAAVAGTGANVQIGSSINVSRCNAPDIPTIVTSLERLPSGDKRLTTSLPPCAQFAFYGASDNLLMKSLHGDQLIRNANISYEFPELAVEETGKLGKRRVASYGRTMVMAMRGAAVLYYDPAVARWVRAD